MNQVPGACRVTNHRRSTRVFFSLVLQQSSPRARCIPTRLTTGRAEIDIFVHLHGAHHLASRRIDTYRHSNTFLTKPAQAESPSFYSFPWRSIQTSSENFRIIPGRWWCPPAVVATGARRQAPFPARHSPPASAARYCGTRGEALPATRIPRDRISGHWRQCG